jgi:hypothetical protein
MPGHSLGVTCALLMKIRIIDPARIGEISGHSLGVTSALLTKIKIIDPARIGEMSEHSLGVTSALQCIVKGFDHKKKDWRERLEGPEHSLGHHSPPISPQQDKWY